MAAAPEVVEDFKTELNTMFRARLPISRAKMLAITKKAMKAIKFYKHVVMIVEKFILKASSTHKLPGLYVIDSIVRQCRHQYTGPKEVYGPRFAKNFEKTFTHLFECSEKDQSKILRVLDLWKTNTIYQNSVIDPLIKLTPPTAVMPTVANSNATPQEQPSSSTHIEDPNQEAHMDSLLHQQQKQLETLIEAGAGQPMISLLLDKAQQLQELQAIQHKLSEDATPTGSGRHSHSGTPMAPPIINESKSATAKLSEFSKALLDDFDYSSDEEDGSFFSQPRPLTSSDPSPMISSDGPVISVSETMAATAFIEELNKQFMENRAGLEGNAHPLNMSPHPPRFGSPPGMDRHPPPPPMNAPPTGDWMQGPPPRYNHPPLPGPPSRWSDRWSPPPRYPLPPNDYPPPRGYPPPPPPPGPPYSHRSPPFRPRDRRPSHRERSPTHRHDMDRSPAHRDRSPYRGRRDRSPFRGRSPLDRRGSSPYSGRGERRTSTERRWSGRDRSPPPDRDSRRIHPPPKQDHTTVCSKTVWIGHLGKGTSKEQIEDAIKEFGPVKSIDHVVARGCAYIVMENRRDAVKAVDRLIIKGQKCKVALALGRGVKDKAYKEYWDESIGTSYLPHKVVLSAGGSAESLSDGGWVDPSTLPAGVDGANDTVVDMAID